MGTEAMIRPRHRLLGGVCAGFAEHTGVPVAAVRTATVLLAACGGAGVLLYLWLWVMTPTRAADAPLDPRAHLLRPSSSVSATNAVPQRRAPITEILLGIALLAAGTALVATRTGLAIPLEAVIPVIVVLAGAALAWRQFGDRGRSPGSPALLVRVLGALVLVVLGILLFFVTGEQPNMWTVIVAALAVLLGVAVVVAPWALQLNRDLADERAARLREVDRAEVAAHLHDSVLQTLALIQQQAGPGSEASRLARAQERELREWLFSGGSAATGDLATELRAIAATVEADHSVRVDVVAVGRSVEDVPEPLLAAAREAVLNAARHAGGDVSVYVETSPHRVEVSVSDRGPGFDLDRVPQDRLGVRESIIGRMQRIGGEAAIRPGPGGRGTEVRLTLPIAAAPTDRTTETPRSVPRSPA
ncbi:PspC domain-containing protein [Plantibacter flavus]|uniref:ATP-binding protein n=1 Tax=Plantibacter flavus TaxID=150123 RepID=UPI003F13540D